MNLDKESEEIKRMVEQAKANIALMSEKGMDKETVRLIEGTRQLNEEAALRIAKVAAWEPYLFWNAELSVEEKRHKEYLVPRFAQKLEKHYLLPVKGQEKGSEGIVEIFNLKDEQDFEDRITKDAPEFISWIIRTADHMVETLDSNTKDLLAVFGRSGEKEGLRTIYEDALKLRELMPEEIKRLLDSYPGLLRINTKLRRENTIAVGESHAVMYTIASRSDRIRSQLTVPKDLDAQIEAKRKNLADIEAKAAAKSRENADLDAEYVAKVAKVKPLREEIDSLTNNVAKYQASLTDTIEVLNKARAKLNLPPLSVDDVRRDAP